MRQASGTMYHRAIYMRNDFRKKNLKKSMIHCYIRLKVLILLTKCLLQTCYMSVTCCYTGFPAREYEKAIFKTLFSYYKPYGETNV